MYTHANKIEYLYFSFVHEHVNCSIKRNLYEVSGVINLLLPIQQFVKRITIKKIIRISEEFFSCKKKLPNKGLKY